METICMQCQILFSGENITNLSSDELAQRVVKVKLSDCSFFFFFFFQDHIEKEQTVAQKSFQKYLTFYHWAISADEKLMIFFNFSQ